MTPLFRCYLVKKNHEGVTGSLEERSFGLCPASEVTIAVRYSSLNYKDALAATGYPGVARNFPHVPGIDAAGVVMESNSPEFPCGTEVLATGHELGVERWGGWAEQLRCPTAWLVRRPEGLSLEESMALGTAGFTAAQCVMALIHAGITPPSGPIAVTGSTGGVGSIAVQILSQLGYEVVAVSGKPERTEWLQHLGASRVISRQEFLDAPDRPLLRAAWAGGVDTVGGKTLSTLLKSVSQRGCVAACGVVGGADLPTTVYPFILRGITLAGIDSAWCPDDRRIDIWQRLASSWKPRLLAELTKIIRLDDVGAAVHSILKGEIAGRTVISL